MNIVCFVSGSGTNYREIVLRNPDHNYLLFSNRPDCGGVSIARKNGHEIIILSQVPFLLKAKGKYGRLTIPRNCPERVQYERNVVRLIEEKLGREPDLICLAGYDQWLTDWTVEKYFPRILNVHPGDTTRGYDGLHWIPTAKAILAGDRLIRSTLFFVDKGEDNGPVLLQSTPLFIVKALTKLEENNPTRLLSELKRVVSFAESNQLKTYEEFTTRADTRLRTSFELICSLLQGALKEAGDWKVFPYGVHDLIAAGRVEIDGKTLYIDGKRLSSHGLRLNLRS
jgi:folate-dependent phosphoribosylglycinamide formyltransferase PurN